MSATKSRPIDLSYALSLEPEKAVEYLRAKGLQVSEGWRTVSEAAHAKAFTVANVSQLNVLADIQAEVLRALKDGQTLEQFKARLMPTLIRKGWFAARGEPVWAPDGTPPDPATGEQGMRKRLTARRLETIYRTNMQSSMMAGRWRELVANADKRPYIRYVAVLDGRTRPAHRALNGLVLRIDDPAWGSILPPNGFRCRCRVSALGAADVAEQGVTVESSEGRLSTSHVPLPDGSTSTVTRFERAKGQTFTTDPGFNGNQAALQAVERQAVLRAPQVLPAVQAEGALRELFTDPVRTTALQSFAADAREAGKPMGVLMGVGSLDEAAVLKLADVGQGADPTGPITLSDAQVQQSGELSTEQWAALPEVLAYGALSWDAREQLLLYVLSPAAVGRGQVMQVSVKATLAGNVVQAVKLLPKRAKTAGERVRAALAGPKPGAAP